MKIYTKKGDGGETSLIGGVRVKKSNARIHAYGNVDELNAIVGLIKDSIDEIEITEELYRIQNELFVIGSLLAAAPGAKMQLPEISDKEVKMLEVAMDDMNEQLEDLKNFILPGGNLAISYAHLARTVCRRAERWVITVSEEEDVAGVILEYLNRLSDYFFVLARYIGHLSSIPDIPWKPLKD